MTFAYSTEVKASLFGVIESALKKGGAPTLVVQSLEGIELVSLPFTSPMQVVQSEEAMTLKVPPPALVLEDGEAAIGILINGDLEEVVRFSVGSPTTNPSAELILSSTALYAGGMLVVSEIKITA